MENDGNCSEREIKGKDSYEGEVGYLQQPHFVRQEWHRCSGDDWPFVPCCDGIEYDILGAPDVEFEPLRFSARAASLELTSSGLMVNSISH